MPSLNKGLGGFSQSLNLYSNVSSSQQSSQFSNTNISNIDSAATSTTTLATSICNIASSPNFNYASNSPLVHTPQTPTTSLSGSTLAGSSPITSKNLSIILPGDKKPKMINPKKQDIKADVVSFKFRTIKKAFFLNYFK